MPFGRAVREIKMICSLLQFTPTIYDCPQMGQTEPNSQFFVDVCFCRFSLFLGSTAFGRRRFSQQIRVTGSHCLERSGKKKAHKHELFCPVGLGTTPGLSRGFYRHKGPATQMGGVLPYSGVLPYFLRDPTGFQGRKRHININFLVRLVLGQARVFSLLYTVETRFHRVCPGTNPAWDEGRHRKFMWKMFMCLFRSLSATPRSHFLYGFL